MYPEKTMPAATRYTAAIFDLGDVLFTWSPPTALCRLPSQTLRGILRSVHWFEYEKGNITEEAIYDSVAKEFGVAAADVKEALEAARESVQTNVEVAEVIRELKKAGFSLYAMSNISAPDWAVLSATLSKETWALFDRVYTSAGAHERKPNIGFYKHVIENSAIDPTRTVFIDDKLENVLTARSFGMKGIVFNNQAEVVRQLRNLCGNPTARGREYLASRSQRHISVTSDNVQLPENFAQLLILEATGDESLVEYTKHTGQFNFFRGTQEHHSNDLDTTGIGLSVCDYIDKRTKHQIMDEMLRYRTADGIIQVYFDHSRPRIDPIVCVNVLSLFYQNGRGHELSETLGWVDQVLRNRAYVAGTYYYASGDHFLFFFSRLMQRSPEVHRRFAALFKERVSERIGSTGDALSLAGRIIAASVVDVIDEQDFETLLALQNEDGSWSNSWFYKYGSTGVLIANDGLTTALGVRAVEEVERLRRDGSVKPADR